MSGKKKVMVIDDEKDFLDELQETLMLSGYDAYVYVNGDLALRSLEKLKPDIIFLDLKMEGKSGFQVAKELGESGKVKGVPIYAITGYYTQREYQELIRELGVKECLIKPVKPLDIIARVESAIRNDTER